MKNVRNRQQPKQRAKNRLRPPIVIISQHNRNNKNENSREKMLQKLIKNQSVLHNFDVFFPNVVFKWPLNKIAQLLMQF